MIDAEFPTYVICFFITFLATVILERIFIPVLRAKAAQPIYTDGPSWHMSKSGTPTMGGLAFVIACVIALMLADIYLFSTSRAGEAMSLLLCASFALLNSVIGIIDDTKKLARRQNAGLTPWQKLILQSVIASLFLYSRSQLLGEGGRLFFSYGGVDIGFIYYPLSFLILLGITNCANLTDGIDGLAASVAFACGVSLFYISCALNTETSFISSAVMGAALGFLIFNMNPAKIFMGDTGSLFFGAILASSVFSLGNPLLILFIGGIYVLEGVSVILQVIYFKLTGGKRLFKMAPLHHHLERSGWAENKICIVAILLTFLLSLPAFVFYLP